MIAAITLDPILEIFLPILFLVIAMAFDNRVFGFFGGITCLFVGLDLLTTWWLGLIFIGLAMYFILASIFMGDN